jgi:hypothetical protein
MPYVNFGTKDEAGFELIESPDLIDVRTRSRRPVRGVGPMPRPTIEEEKFLWSGADPKTLPR